MPFGIQSAGVNSTTLKKLKNHLKSKEVLSSESLSRMLDVELGAVTSQMNFFGYKSSGEKMSKSEHKKFIDGLQITKRADKATDLERILSKSESINEEIQVDKAREASAKAELAELELNEKKSVSPTKAVGKNTK